MIIFALFFDYCSLVHASSCEESSSMPSKSSSARIDAKKSGAVCKYPPQFQSAFADSPPYVPYDDPPASLHVLQGMSKDEVIDLYYRDRLKMDPRYAKCLLDLRAKVHFHELLAQKLALNIIRLTMAAKFKACAREQRGFACALDEQQLQQTLQRKAKEKATLEYEVSLALGGKSFKEFARKSPEIHHFFCECPCFFGRTSDKEKGAFDGIGVPMKHSVFFGPERPPPPAPKTAPNEIESKRQDGVVEDKLRVHPKSTECDSLTIIDSKVKALAVNDKLKDDPSDKPKEDAPRKKKSKPKRRGKAFRCRDCGKKGWRGHQ